MTNVMLELETFDISHVVRKQRENLRMKRDLEKCQDELQATPHPPTPRPRTYTLAFHLTDDSNGHS